MVKGQSRIGFVPIPVSIQISVATILTHAYKTREHQNLLAEFGVVDGCVRTLLAASPGHSDVQVPALKLLAFLVFRYIQLTLSFYCFIVRHLSTK